MSRGKLRPVATPVLPGAAISLDVRAEAFADAVVPYNRREDYVAEIACLWEKAQKSFVLIGRYLEAAKEKLPHGEFEEMISRELPFNRRVAHMLRVAAKALTSGRLPADRLPPNYSIIYALSTFDDAMLRVAEERGLIRRDVRRAEIEHFKRELGVGGHDGLVELRRARDRLLTKRAEIEAELARIEERLRDAAAIKVELSDDNSADGDQIAAE